MGIEIRKFVSLLKWWEMNLLGKFTMPTQKKKFLPRKIVILTKKSTIFQTKKVFSAA